MGSAEGDSGVNDFLKACESPAELAFAEAICRVEWARPNGPAVFLDEMLGTLRPFMLLLMPQRSVEIEGRRYRADFMAIYIIPQATSASGAPEVCKLVAIEIDGFAYHDAMPEQAEKQRVRDRAFLSAGIQTLRFAAREVFRDADACADSALRSLWDLAPKATVTLSGSDAVIASSAAQLWGESR